VLTDGPRPVTPSSEACCLSSNSMNGKVRGLPFQRHGSSVQNFQGRVAEGFVNVLH